MHDNQTSPVNEATDRPEQSSVGVDQKQNVDAAREKLGKTLKQASSREMILNRIENLEDMLLLQLTEIREFKNQVRYANEESLSILEKFLTSNHYFLGNARL